MIPKYEKAIEKLKAKVEVLEAELAHARARIEFLEREKEQKRLEEERNLLLEVTQ